MKRWLWFSVSTAVGLGLLACGYFMPAHLRAVDVKVIARGGQDSPSLPEEGLALVRAQQLGAAQLLLQEAQRQGLADQKLAQALDAAAQQNPAAVMWGGADAHLARFFDSDTKLAAIRSEPFTQFMVRSPNREMVLGLLGVSRKPVVRELLRCRQLTNTVLFAPALSPAGQALDTALGVTGLLLEGGYLRPGLTNTLYSLEQLANGERKPEPLEEVLLDLMSLGQRFNWGQLVLFVRNIADVETLSRLAAVTRSNSAATPEIFAAVYLSGQPKAVAHYLDTYGRTGLADLGTGLRYGAGGLETLLRRNQRVYSSGPGMALGTTTCWRMPVGALMLKWLLYLVSGFLLAAALHFVRPRVSALEQPLQVRGFHFAREILFALGFLVVVLFLSEPFLTQDTQKVEFPLRLRLPTMGSVVPPGGPQTKPSVMNEVMLLTLLLFFVLQGLLYTASLVKLAEIRRQKVPARVKLKLLENEDHLFDAGLYLGFAGTIISLILVSMGVFKLSLMAAYSSTSFGIIFVSIFKICHLRPSRRRLLLEAEAAEMDALAEQADSSLVMPS